MLRFMLCIILVAGLASAECLSEQNLDIMTARCRAQCLYKFHSAGPRKNCFDSSECWMCWDTCHMFYKNFKVWGPMCTAKRICFPGCQESCGFYNSHSDVQKPEKVDMQTQQPLTYSYVPETDVIHFEWSKPGGYNRIEPLVYVLMMKEELDSNWYQLEQTFYHNTTIRRGLLKASGHVRLISFSPEGQIAQIEKSGKEFGLDLNGANSKEMPMDERYSHHQRDDWSSFTTQLDHHKHWKPALQSLRSSTRYLGGVDAIVTWTHVSHKVELQYEIEWKQIDQAIDITGRRPTFTRNVDVVTLWPNSLYEVTVHALSPNSHRPVARSKALIVDTALHAVSEWHTYLDHCTGCISVQYLMMAAMLFVVLTFIIGLVLAKLDALKRNSGVNKVKPNATVQPIWKETSLRHTSVKRQLSSLGAHFGQGSLSPSVKHDRLIEEEPSLVSDEIGKTYHDAAKFACLDQQ